MSKSKRRIIRVDTSAKAMRAIARKEQRKGSETKQWDSTWNADAIQDSARTPLSGNLALVPQGLGQNDRTGNRITLTGLYGKLQISGADSTNFIRLIIFIPHNVNNTGVGITNWGLLDQDQQTVLYDRVFVTSSNGPNAHSITIKKSFTRGGRRGIMQHYTGASGSTINKNALYYYFVSDSGAVSDPTISGHIRVYYTDS